MPALPRIGLLTYGLDRPLSGVTRVALELGRALQRSGACEVVYLTPYRRGPFRNDANTSSWYLPGCARLPGLMLLGGPLISIAARRLKLDLVHDPIGISPFTLGRWAGRFGRVATIHDAIAFRYPEGYPWLNNLLHRHYVPATLANLDAVVTDSESAGSDLRHFLGLSRERVRVVPLAAGPEFRPLSQGEVERTLARYGLTEPYVLHIGAQQARKNVTRLLAAFALVRAELPQYRLVLAGPSLWRHADLRDQIADQGLEQAVSLLGYLPEGDLPALYNGASLFAFPSLYEGFGLPVLESMACGTPVVCSNTTSLPEVAGDAAMLVDPLRTDALVDGIRRALLDHELRETLRARGLAQAARFTWQQTALDTVAVYKSVLAP